ncbi:hypothetical protein HaLaN_06785, partial [Haematococcus lacustris]
PVSTSAKQPQPIQTPRKADAAASGDAPGAADAQPFPQASHRKLSKVW